MGYFQILGKCHICYKFIERMIDALSTIYLLQICGKMIEVLFFICNSLILFLKSNNLVTPSQ